MLLLPQPGRAEEVRDFRVDAGLIWRSVAE
jgi:hypothetical protein